LRYEIAGEPKHVFYVHQYHELNNQLAKLLRKTIDGEGWCMRVAARLSNG